MNKKNIVAFIFSILLVTGAFFWKQQKTNAVGIYNLIGGKIENVQYCCNGIILTVQGPSGDDFFMSWADIANPTVNYLNKNVWIGFSQNTVGKALPFGVCVDIGSECEDSDSVSGGTVFKIGTSLLPSS